MIKPMTTDRLKFSKSIAIAWALLAVSLVAPIAALTFPYLHRVERILENEATAVGKFTGKDCAQHGSRSYAFDVDGKSYHGGGSSEAGGNCETVPIGAPIVVHYERSDPANNTGGAPASELWNDIAFMILVALLFPPVIIWRFRKWRARGYPLYWGGS